MELSRLVRDEGPVRAVLVRVSAGAPVRLRAVLSNDRVGGPGPVSERTSEMCRRVSCLAALNADFAHPDTGQPVGGVVKDGQLLRSPVGSHHQLWVGADGTVGAGSFTWSGRLVLSDLSELALSAVNVGRAADQLVLFTPAQGSTTGTNSHGVELVLRLVEPPSPLALGQTAVVEFVEGREEVGDTRVPADGAVLSGHGSAAEALRSLWARVQAGAVARRALLRLETAPAVRESVGGTPIMLREGRRWVNDDGSPFVRGRHPRSLVGWDAHDGVLLVAVDGRQPGHSVGLSLPEAADLLAGLGATEGINLDGGGSTTLAVAGQVVNRPSDRLVAAKGGPRIVPEAAPAEVTVGPVERPVASALAVVPRDPPPPRVAPGAEPFTESLGLPRELRIPAPTADAASRPGGGLPALVALTPHPKGVATPPLVLAVAANGLAAGAVGGFLLRSRARPRTVGLRTVTTVSVSSDQRASGVPTRR